MAVSKSPMENMVNKNKTGSDFLVIGGGVIGLSVARELKKAWPGCSVTLIEKEPECGMHASGRNSGVLHAGFYYSADSLKARFTKTGNEQMTAYCRSRNIRLNRCGKLVVAKDEKDLAGLDELMKRARANGIELHQVTEKEAREIEPRVKTFGTALFSPTTSTVNPSQVVKTLRQDACLEGVKVHCGVRYTGFSGGKVRTSCGIYNASYHVNTAGLYADRIAMDFGFSSEYRLLPFKGLYLYSDEPPGSLRTNVYPVPDLRNPFLGVHFTVTSEGKNKIGPTAIPAFWREHYEGVSNFSPSELLEIVGREIDLLLSSRFEFGKLAVDEVRKYSKNRLVELSTALVSGVKKENFKTWGKPGIRAQLVDIRKKKLEMDFVVQGDSRSMHVLNAVSPAFTCAMSFSEHVCQMIKSKLS